jgi:glutaredoxin
VVAKNLLESKGIEYEVKMAGVDYDVDDLRQLGVRMLPYIEKGGERVGSLEDLVKEVSN